MNRHQPVHMFIRTAEPVDYPDPSTIMRLVSLAVYPAQLDMKNGDRFKVIAM